MQRNKEWNRSVRIELTLPPVKEMDKTTYINFKKHLKDFTDNLGDEGICGVWRLEHEHNYNNRITGEGGEIG